MANIYPINISIFYKRHTTALISGKSGDNNDSNGAWEKGHYNDPNHQIQPGSKLLIITIPQQFATGHKSLPPSYYKVCLLHDRSLITSCYYEIMSGQCMRNLSSPTLHMQHVGHHKPSPLLTMCPMRQHSNIALTLKVLLFPSLRNHLLYGSSNLCLPCRGGNL